LTAINGHLKSTTGHIKQHADHKTVQNHYLLDRLLSGHLSTGCNMQSRVARTAEVFCSQDEEKIKTTNTYLFKTILTIDRRTVFNLPQHETRFTHNYTPTSAI